MPELIPGIINSWLEPAVPTSLKDMDGFQEVTDATETFCTRLETLKFSGFEDLQEWVQNVPRVWLAKCRETALDLIRTKLSQGLGEPKEIERVETRTVSQEEGRQLAPNSAIPTNTDGWDAAWDDGEVANNAEDLPKQPKNEEAGDDGADAWGWGDDDNAIEADTAVTHAEPKHNNNSNEEEDPAAAWGWGDDDDTADVSKDSTKATDKAKPTSSTRELTLKETYNISSMPEPVITLILSILEDGASLVGYVHHHLP